MSDERSNNAIELKNLRDRVDRDRKADAERSEKSLKGGGGGGTSNGMEARVAHLESDIGHIKSDVSDIKGTLKDLDAHVTDTAVRVARLESDIGNVKSDIGDIKGTLKELDAHVSETEVRVARLESDIGNLKSDIGNLKSDIKSESGNVRSEIKDIWEALKELKTQVATLTERVNHLPTKGYIGTLIAAWAAAIITALTLLSRFGWLVPGPPTH
jgi:chromosome segregation ATPase